ncbi:MAG: AraC family ligand binding domain-containing protein, partial [Bulleidia sp.]
MAIIPYRSHIITDDSGRELELHGTMSFPVACYYTDSGSEPVPPHWHNEFEIILVVRGEMMVQAQMKQFRLPAGTGIFVNSNILHGASGFIPDTCFHSLVFSPALIGGSEQSIFWKNYLMPLLRDHSLPFLCLSDQISWQKQLLEEAEKAWEEADREQPGYEFRIRSDLSECIFLLDQNADHQNTIEDRKRYLREQRLKTMLTYISTHYSEEISLADIAGSAAVSPTECMRCFREGVSLSPIQYLKKYRLFLASGYL